MSVALVVVIILLVLAAIDAAAIKWGFSSLLVLFAIAIILLTGAHI